MKKIIAKLLVVFVFTFAFGLVGSAQVVRRGFVPDNQKSSVNTSSHDRVKIEVRGFQDSIQAQLLISQFMAKEATWATIVESQPDIIMVVSCTMSGGQTWTQVDRKAQSINGLLRTADQTMSNLVYSYYSQSRVTSFAKQTAYNVGRSQLQSMARPENYQFQTNQASVVIDMVDYKTKQVVSRAIGRNAITLKGIQAYGYEPKVVLQEGDLTSVGMRGGENLYGTWKQLLQLSAFMNAQLPENHIVK